MVVGVNERRGPTRPAFRRLIGALVVVEALAVATLFVYEHLSLRARRTAYSSTTAPPEPWMKVDLPGVSRPSVSSAGRAGLPADEEVIGVVIAGRARAYRLRALADRSRHVVNDLLGGRPVSVSYCDISDCVRGYTGPKGAGPLDIRIAGLFDGKGMVLRMAGGYFLQESGAAVPSAPGPSRSQRPYDALPVTRTTWGEWKRLYPDTDVYVGDPGR